MTGMLFTGYFDRETNTINEDASMVGVSCKYKRNYYDKIDRCKDYSYHHLDLLQCGDYIFVLCSYC